MGNLTGRFAKAFALLIVVALAVSAPSGFGARSSEGPPAGTAKKKHHRSCAKTKGKKKKKKNCKKGQGPGDGQAPSPAHSALNCPTGTVSGSVPLTITGTAMPVPQAIGFNYSVYSGSPSLQPRNAYPVPDSSGNWSFTFTPNEASWFGGTWTEHISANNTAGNPVGKAECEFQVGT